MTHGSATRRILSRTWVALTAAFFVTSSGSIARGQTLEWDYGASLPQPMSRSAAVAASDGHVYLFGGLDDGADEVADVVRFDPLADEYVALTPMPAARAGACAAELMDGRILVIWGIWPGESSNAGIYDPGTDSWSGGYEVQSDGGCAAVTAPNGWIHVLGGESDPDGHAIFDPGTDLWTAGPAMPRQHELHGAALGGDGRIYVFGGRDGHADIVSPHLDIYDPDSESWSTGADMPEGNLLFATASSGDRIHVLGGSTETPWHAGPYFDVVWTYEVASDVWTVEDSVLPTAVKEPSGAWLDGRIFAFGGRNETTQAVLQIGETRTDADGDGWYDDEDCDDEHANIHPGAQELCNDVDDDCDGEIDEDVDYDQDGWIGCGGDDCNDYLASAYPGAEEIPYDQIDQDCDGADLVDVDGDGFDGGPYGEDCVDEDASVHPGAEEACDDGVDNDCNGMVDGSDPDCSDPADDDDTICRPPPGPCECRADVSRLDPWAWVLLIGAAWLFLRRRSPSSPAA